MKVCLVYFTLLSLISSVQSFRLPFLQWFVAPSSLAAKSNLRGYNGGGDAAVQVLTVYNFVDVPSLVFFGHNDPVNQVPASIDDPLQDDLEFADDDGLVAVLGDVFYDDFELSDPEKAEYHAGETTETKQGDDLLLQQQWDIEFNYTGYYDDDYWATWETPSHEVQEDMRDDAYDHYNHRSYAGVDDDWLVDDDDWWETQYRSEW